jgi:hypothetical protein
VSVARQCTFAHLALPAPASATLRFVSTAPALSHGWASWKEALQPQPRLHTAAHAMATRSCEGFRERGCLEVLSFREQHHRRGFRSSECFCCSPAVSFAFLGFLLRQTHAAHCGADLLGVSSQLSRWALFVCGSHTAQPDAVTDREALEVASTSPQQGECPMRKKGSRAKGRWRALHCLCNLWGA